MTLVAERLAQSGAALLETFEVELLHAIGIWIGVLLILLR